MPTIQIGNQTFQGSVRDCISFIQAQAEEQSLPPISKTTVNRALPQKSPLLTKNNALICWTSAGVKRTIAAKAVAEYNKLGARALNLTGSNGYSRQAKESRGTVIITWTSKVGARKVEETATIPSALLKGDK